MASRLTAKQKKFVDEYLIDLNATQAAIRAGYSEKTANRIASENLSKLDVQSYLQKRQKELQKHAAVTPEKVIAELAHIAFDDMKNYLDFYPGTDGDIKVDIKDSRKIDTRSVSEVSIGRDGQFKFKLYCKDNALAQLGKHLGLFEGKTAEPDNDGITNFLSALSPKESELKELFADEDNNEQETK